MNSNPNGIHQAFSALKLHAIVAWPHLHFDEVEWKRANLFHASDSHVFKLVCFTHLEQLVVHFASAEHEALDVRVDGILTAVDGFRRLRNQPARGFQSGGK